jgi:two-component system phosphate regulon response regulator PhoB
MQSMLIRRSKPDMVVLDWIMPHLNGTEVFRQMRETPEMAAIPVVFLTVRAHWRTTEELLALGGAGVITKPLSAKDLSDQLKAIWKGLPEAGVEGS